MIRRILTATVSATLLVLSASPSPGSARQDGWSVIATHLDQPKKVTVSSRGDLIVALSGNGSSPTSCTDSDELSCENRSGSVEEITPSGRARVLLSGLTSVSAGHDDPQATGPVEARLIGGRLQVLFQDLDLTPSTGISEFGPASLLGDLVSFPSAATSDAHSDPRERPHSGDEVKASLGVYEAIHDPDRSALGSAVKFGYEGAINSDPYSFVSYRGGWAVADAGANDVLWISPSGAVRVIAVLPTIREHAKAGTYGSAQTRPIEAEAQSVPTAVAVGPDGALYVGELGGAPFSTGTEDIYRIAPGHRATVWARGFTSIADISFDHSRLLVLEIDRKGLGDPGLDDDRPASGELIAVNYRESASGPRAGRRTTLLAHGLSMPTGLAVGSDGAIYLTDDGTTTDGGKLLRYNLS